MFHLVALFGNCVLYLVGFVIIILETSFFSYIFGNGSLHFVLLPVSVPCVTAVLSTGSPSVICSCGTLARPFRSSTRSLSLPPYIVYNAIPYFFLAILYVFFVVVFKFHSFFSYNLGYFEVGLTLLLW